MIPFLIDLSNDWIQFPFGLVSFLPRPVKMRHKYLLLLRFNRKPKSKP